MYPVKLGFETATKRICELENNGHHAEALVTTVFTFEKTLRRYLRFCGLSRGFTSKQCNTLFKGMGFHRMKDIWPCFDKNHTTLPDLIGQSWEHVPKAVTMRNDLVHGNRVYDLDKCTEYSSYVMTAMKEFRDVLICEYNYDAWDQIPVKRKSTCIWIQLTKKKKVAHPAKNSSNFS